MSKVKSTLLIYDNNDNPIYVVLKQDRHVGIEGTLDTLFIFFLPEIYWNDSKNFLFFKTEAPKNKENGKDNSIGC